MMFVKFVLTFCSFIVCQGEFQSMQNKPKTFKMGENKLLNGRWFCYASIPSASWPGAATLTDMSNKVTWKKGVGTVQLAWRSNGHCTHTVHTCRMVKGSPGEMMVQDSLGGIYSKTFLFVGFHQRCFVLSWGCPHFDPKNKNKCLDPDLYLYTRSPKPSKKCYKLLTRTLYNMYGLTLGNMMKGSHNDPCPIEKPCVPIKYGRQYFKRY